MRRAQLTFVIIAALALAVSACDRFGKPGAVTSDDMSLGDPSAKVTMIEYASVACPHCARFNNEVFPAFKQQFIDTGKVHYVFREMLVGGDQEMSMAAAGFLMARCAGKDKYFGVVDTIFHDQEQIYQSGDVRDGLLKIAESTGMTEPQFASCISDDQSIKALNDRVETYSKRDHITGTPTFIINGKMLDGEQSLATLTTAVNAAQAAAK
jgi:protein-disulfide isomerase